MSCKAKLSIINKFPSAMLEEKLNYLPSLSIENDFIKLMSMKR